MTRPLLIVGNKRSGTSQLVRLLNLHSNVFVSHESDIVWLLYQYHKGEPYRAHPWDSEKGMRSTLEQCGHLLRPDSSPWENFLTLEKYLMEQGTRWLPAQKKPDLLWLGDKKPFQHTDPQLVTFIREHFPDAHLLHIVRHPFGVAASSNRMNERKEGDFWLDLSSEEKVERWAFHEKQVQILRKELGDRLHTVRYEDLCQNTEQELVAIFDFLHLKLDDHLLKEAALQTQPRAHAAPAIACSAEVADIAAVYGYDLQHSTSRVEAWARSAYCRLAKRLKK